MKIRTLKKRPECANHVVQLYRAAGGPIPPVDARAAAISAGWGAKILGVLRQQSGEEIVHTYWCKG